MHVQTSRVSKGEAVRSERVPVDLTEVKVDEIGRGSVLELQNWLLDFSRDGTNLDGHTVVQGGDVRSRVGTTIGTHIDNGAAGALVADVDVDFKIAGIEDGSRSAGRCCGISICVNSAHGEGWNSRSSSDGGRAGGQGYGYLAGRRGCCNEGELSHGYNGSNDFWAEHVESGPLDATGAEVGYIVEIAKL